MYLEFLKPEIFDAIIIINIALGLLIAARRFRKDITGPLPEDAPHSFRDQIESNEIGPTPDSA